MTLPLELGPVEDSYARRALEQLALQFPISAPSRPALAALPANPYDGQEVYYLSAAMSAAGQSPWHLRYRASSPNAHRWDVIAAGDWRVQGVAQVTNTVANAWQYSAPPSIVLPLGGVYQVLYGAQVWRIVTTTVGDSYITVGLDSVGGAGQARSYSPTPAAAGQNELHSVVNIGTLTGNAGQTIVLGYWTANGAGYVAWDGPFISARPVRVG